MILRSWSLAVLIAGAGLAARPAASQPEPDLATAIEDVLLAAPMANAWWGAIAIDLDTGRVLYEMNADRSFMPASVTKLFTTAAALHVLGPHFTYRTRLYAEGPVEGDTLQGNLVVRGAGDPTFGVARPDRDALDTFRAWADSLRAAGIRRIAGGIVGDDDVFDDVPLGDSWSWDDLQYGYAAEISGLSFHENVVKLRIAPTRPGSPGAVTWQPDNTDYVTISNRSRTAARGASLVDGYQRQPGTNRFEVTSEVPVSRVEQEELSVHNPTLYFAHVLREVLRAEGIEVDGMPMDVDRLAERPDYDSAELRIVARHTSAPLSELAREINKESNNLWAEQVLRTLGAASDTAGSAEGGHIQAKAVFAEAGIDTSRLQLVDGSGLSRKNLVTPRMATDLLRFMARHDDRAVQSAFLESLAVGGRDGTLEYRFRGGTPDVRAKTGSLGNVSALSGYVRTRDGRLVAFALFCNHYTTRSALVRSAQDAIVTILGSASVR